VAVLPTPQGALSADAPTSVLLMPNVRAKLATTAWRAGQQAQNGAKPRRLMASVTCRWRSA
jgi:hypothetical protein